MIKKDKDREKLSAEIARLHRKVADLIASKYKLQNKTRKLRESQKRLISFTQATFEGVAIHDQGSLLDANQKLARMFGYKLSELKRMNLDDLLVPQSRPLISKIIKAHEKKPYQVLCLKKNGSTFPAELRTKIISQEGQKVKIVSIRNITKQKYVEAKLKHLNAVLRAIRQVNQLIVKEKNRDKLLQDACDSLIKTFGYGNAWIAIFSQSGKLIKSAEAGFGRHFQPLLKLLQQGKFPSCVNRALSRSSILIIRNPEVSCPDCPLHHKYNGRGPMIIRLQHKSKIYGLLNVSIPQEFLSEKEEKSLFREVAGDISFALYSLELEEARKQAEIKVKEARNFAESIVSTIREPLLILDSSLKVISANRSFYRMFKVSPSETEGRLIYELGARQWDIPRLRGLLESILPQNTFFDNFEVTHDFPDIGRRTILLNARRIYREANKTQMILLAMEDITERRKREMEIRDYREKLRLLALKLSRTEELERRKLAAFLHDQIGQKLALAKIELGTLSESAAEGKVVEDQVRKLRKLIEDTIKDTRQLTFELNPPLLDQLGLEGSLKWLIDQYREKYKLQCNFTDDGQPKPLAKNLPSALFQSVKELLLNVLKHAQADKADVEVGRVGNKIQIRVKDNGVGFDPSERKPYSPQSAGFGLFHIKERLKDYNGGLDIKSEKGKGTKVVLWGPLAVSKKTFD